MNKRRKILILSSFNIFPPYWGGASRVYNLTKEIAKKHQVWLVCNDFRFLKENEKNKTMSEFKTKTKVRISIVKEFGLKTQILNPRVFLKALKIIRKEKTEIIIATFLYSAFHAMILKFITGTPYILDEHNVEYLKHERISPKRMLPRVFLKILEKMLCNFSSKIFCVSEKDKQLFISKMGINKNKIIVIPNAVDTEKFYPNLSKKVVLKKTLNVDNEPIILFFGKLDYQPNIEAIKIIHDEILPRIIKKIPNIKFLIVGDNPPTKFKHENILIPGLVDKIEDYINLSDVVVCPLLSGGGTRIKILEALACGKTVISTTVGAEGINFKEYEDILLLRDDWDSFSAEILRSLTNDGKNKDHDFYSISWKKSLDDIDRALQDLISENQS